MVVVLEKSGRLFRYGPTFIVSPGTLLQSETKVPYLRLTARAKYIFLF